uniref:Phospholipid/glycerol acyltransferase domain-containing protein n=1 Tax=Phaeodactylum tricornutum TaxID=2850 RepID=A0A8J9TQR9_PHATR
MPLPEYSTFTVALPASTANAVTELPTTDASVTARTVAQTGLPAWKAALTKYTMMMFILGMCVSLPLTLWPQKLLYKLKLINRVRKERWALATGQGCARWMLRIFPFCSLDAQGYHDPNPQPTIWACNHTSMLDVFLLLAADRALRGPHKRPIKIVYWRGLETNPVTRLLFRQAGFIAVNMADNGNGTANEYDRASFKTFLRETKQAFVDGFDIGILPEGQLNPTPEKGLLPVFSGAYTIAKLSKRPMSLMALHGAHRLWHPDDAIGMTVTGRNVSVRSYPGTRVYTSADEFVQTFQHVVGHFGTYGVDLPRPKLRSWLNGSAYAQLQQQLQDDDQQSPQSPAVDTL